MEETHLRVKTLLVGLISDTHDNLPLVEKTIVKLNEVRVELVLHAGDYVAPFVVPRFKQLNSRLIGVFGNNDGDHELLTKRFCENKRLEIRGSFAKLTVDGLRTILLHGDDRELLDALIESESFDVIVHGHSHTPEAYHKGKTLVVNPGEVCGYLTGRSTFALLDTSKKEAKIHEL